MMNELLFVVHSFLVSGAVLCAVHLGSHALVALISACCMLANLFVLKQTTLFGLNATCADVFTIGATFGLNMLQEYYGPKITKQTITITFFLLMFYTIVTQIHLWYIPHAHDIMHPHFKPLFSHAPRIVIASFVVYFCAQTIDYHLYGLLKTVWPTQWIAVRNGLSTAISQLFDTVSFSFLGLYGLVDSILEIIVISYSVKLIAILLSAPFSALSKRFLHS